MTFSPLESHPRGQDENPESLLLVFPLWEKVPQVSKPDKCPGTALKITQREHLPAAQTSKLHLGRNASRVSDQLDRADSLCQ